MSGLSSNAAAQPSSIDVCHSAQVIEGNSSWRDLGFDAFATRYFRVNLTEPGQLMIDVTPLDTTLVEPKLEFYGRSCGDFDSSFETQKSLEIRKAVTLRYALTGLILSVDQPGDFFFRVAAQNRAEPLMGFVLHSRFVAEPAFSFKDIVESEQDPDL